MVALSSSSDDEILDVEYQSNNNCSAVENASSKTKGNIEPIGYKLAIILHTNVTQIDFHDFRDMTVRRMSFA